MPFNYDPAAFLTSLYSPFMDFMENIQHPINMIQIAVLGILVWTIYKRIKGTQAEQLLKGILVIVFVLLLSKAFNLEIISRVLENLVSVVLFGLVVIFQPELRRVLGYLGQTGVFGRNIIAFSSDEDADKLVNHLIEAIKHLKKTHTGALIVLENTQTSETYIEVGTPINSDVSVELILTIFHPNTPLHDGAIVINSGKIIAAGVLLPLTEDPKLSWQYGTRHRAAIGMSEISTALCIVVSEETGEVSLARDGVLKKYTDIEELRKTLAENCGNPSNTRKKSGYPSKIKEIIPDEFSKIPDILQGSKK